MLHCPTDAHPNACIMGIDPGSNTLGVAIIEFNPVTLEIVSTTAKTFVGKRLGMDAYRIELNGERYERLSLLERELVQIFAQYRPLQVCAESNFMSRRFPSAYGALVETVAMIRRALEQHHPYKPLYMVDPITAKQAVGADIRGGKDAVMTACLALSILKYFGPSPMSELDEHSIDAIAIAYHQYLQLYYTVHPAPPQPEKAPKPRKTPQTTTRVKRARRRSRKKRSKDTA